MSDILIASPLGLRTLLADDFDFLCSVEVLVMDQTDILYMQVILLTPNTNRLNNKDVLITELGSCNSSIPAPSPPA